MNIIDMLKYVENISKTCLVIPSDSNIVHFAQPEAGPALKVPTAQKREVTYPWHSPTTGS